MFNLALFSNKNFLVNPQIVLRPELWIPHSGSDVISNESLVVLWASARCLWRSPFSPGQIVLQDFFMFCCSYVFLSLYEPSRTRCLVWWSKTSVQVSWDQSLFFQVAGEEIGCLFCGGSAPLKLRNPITQLLWVCWWPPSGAVFSHSLSLWVRHSLGRFQTSDAFSTSQRINNFTHCSQSKTRTDRLDWSQAKALFCI